MPLGTQSWHERLWRSNNLADIARGEVYGSRPFAAFGERVTSGATAYAVLRGQSAPDVLTVPAAVAMTFVSTGADTRRMRLVYLDGDLAERSEIVTLTGTTPVSTTATDIRFVNGLYSLDGPLAQTVTVTAGGVTHAGIASGATIFTQALYRVPAGKRLMLNALYAGAFSGSAAAKVVVRAEVSFFDGDSFAAQGILHPVGGVGLQDDAVTLPFGPFPVPAGEIVALTFKCDKAADVVGGFFGWLENI